MELQLAHGTQHSLETSPVHQNSTQMMDAPSTEDSGNLAIVEIDK